MILASIARLPFFGTSKSASRSISLVGIRNGEGELIQSHRVCDFRVLDDSAMHKMIFPDRFVSALAKQSYPIHVEKDGQGWRYRADLGIERIAGINFELGQMEIHRVQSAAMIENDAFTCDDQDFSIVAKVWLSFAAAKSLASRLNRSLLIINRPADNFDFRNNLFWKNNSQNP
jgi:hypothetical protein